MLSFPGKHPSRWRKSIFARRDVMGGECHCLTHCLPIPPFSGVTIYGKSSSAKVTLEGSSNFGESFALWAPWRNRRLKANHNLREAHRAGGGVFAEHRLWFAHTTPSQLHGIMLYFMSGQNNPCSPCHFSPTYRHHHAEYWKGLPTEQFQDASYPAARKKPHQYISSGSHFIRRSGFKPAGLFPVQKDIFILFNLWVLLWTTKTRSPIRPNHPEGKVVFQG